jgi:DNA polymerase III gamma/tau subunit
MSFALPGKAGSESEIKTQDIKELLGIVEVAQVAQFIDKLLEKNVKEAMAFVNLLCDNGVDLQEFTKTLVFYLRQALLQKINPEYLSVQNSGLSAEELEKMITQGASLEQRELQTMLESFIDAENKIKYSTIAQLPLELAILDIIQP